MKTSISYKNRCFLPLILVCHLASCFGSDIIWEGHGGRSHPCSSIPPLALQATSYVLLIHFEFRVKRYEKKNNVSLHKCYLQIITIISITTALPV